MIFFTPIPTTYVVNTPTTSIQQTFKEPEVTYLKDYYPNKLAKARYDSIIDKHGMYNRQCTSYAAFKVKQMTDYNISWWGHAKQWLKSAKSMKVKVSNKAAKYSVAISTKGRYGHAMFVENVSKNGKYMRISEYNGIKSHEYSTRIVKTEPYKFIIFRR